MRIHILTYTAYGRGNKREIHGERPPFTFAWEGYLPAGEYKKRLQPTSQKLKRFVLALRSSHPGRAPRVVAPNVASCIHGPVRRRLSKFEITGAWTVSILQTLCNYHAKVWDHVGATSSPSPFSGCRQSPLIHDLPPMSLGEACQ